MGANADMWDEALGVGTGNEVKRGSKFIPTSSGSGDVMGGPTSGTGSGTGGGGGGIAEAGKIWDRGRNWTGIVLEVIPTSTPTTPTPALNPISITTSTDPEREEGEEHDDDDILQIPLFVRLEYESVPVGTGAEDGQAANGRGKGMTEGGGKGVGGIGSGDGGRVKREIGYWVVLGVGTVCEGLIDRID